MSTVEIIREAKAELRVEARREAIDAAKQRLKNHRPFWQRIFPYKINIERIKNV